MPRIETKDATYSAIEIDTPLGRTVYDPLYIALLDAIGRLNLAITMEKEPAAGFSAVKSSTSLVWTVTLDFVNGRSFDTVMKLINDRMAESNFVLTGDWFLEELEPVRAVRVALKALLQEWHPTKIEIKWRA